MNHDLNVIEKVPSPEPLEVKQLEGGAVLLWRPRAEFGTYLRERREAVGLSLREAAQELDISFARLHKMETGGRFRAPDPSLLSRIATLYRVPPTEVFRKAGFEVTGGESLQREIDFELAFDALAFHPELNPYNMDREWRDAYAPRIKEQWVEFAYKLESRLQGEPGYLERILLSDSKYTQPPSESTPEAYRQWALERMLRSGALLVPKKDAGFGAYLRQLRKDKGVTLQVAASELGMSYGTLHRIETGERAIASIDALRPITLYYGLELEQAMRKLGVDEQAMRVVFKQEAANLEFQMLMDEPALRPAGMTAQWMEKISAAQKRHWVEFAQNVARWLEQGGTELHSLVEAYQRMRELETADSEAEKKEFP